MKICSICHRISGTGQDHIDCVQRRRIELEDEEAKRMIPEKLGKAAADLEGLGVEVRAILEHMAREKGGGAVDTGAMGRRFSRRP